MFIPNLCKVSQLVAQSFAVSKHYRSYHNLLRVSDEVRNAVHTNKPVVALETTIYTHGFPYPDNIELARNLESIVRQNGAIPATVGVLEGEAVVGLTPEQLTRLIKAAYYKNALKVSRRDLIFACGSSSYHDKVNGGTTVSGTMVLAHLAGINILATGGIGGVHRGAQTSMDISADLIELGRTPIAVISSGCKSFLDIPRTLEYLETHGVTVGTFYDGGNTGVDFPAFWSQKSGVRSPSVVKSERHAAAMIHAQQTLPISSGLLLANPIPAASSIPKAKLDIIISQAIEDAEKTGHTGKRNTPYILARITELSQGETVIANRTLIQANVRRGAIIATELAALRNNNQSTALGRVELKNDNNLDSTSMNPKKSDRLTFSSRKNGSSKYDEVSEGNCDIVVAGSVALDFDCRNVAHNTQKPASLQLHTSNPSKISQNIGGVGYNVARAAKLAGSSVRLLSVVGADPAGHVLLDCLKGCNLNLQDIKVITGANTSLYIAFNDASKGLIMATSDMGIFDDEKNAYFVEDWKDEINTIKPSWFIVDANWNPSSLLKFLKGAKANGSKTAFEPVSAPKATRIFSGGGNLPVFPDHHIDIISPNQDELLAIYKAARSMGMLEREDWWQIVSSFGFSPFSTRDMLVKHTSQVIVDAGIPQQCLHLLPFFPEIVVKLGSDGLLLTMLLKADDARLEPNHEAAPWILRDVLSAGYTSSGAIGGIYMRKFDVVEHVSLSDIVSVNGVGDTLLGTLVAKLAQSHGGVEEFIQDSQHAAVRKLKGQ